MMYALVAVGTDSSPTLLAHHSDNVHAHSEQHEDAWEIEFRSAASKSPWDLGLNPPEAPGIYVLEGYYIERGFALDRVWEGSTRKASLLEVTNFVFGSPVFELKSKPSACTRRNARPVEPSLWQHNKWVVVAHTKKDAITTLEACGQVVERTGDVELVTEFPLELDVRGLLKARGATTTYHDTTDAVAYSLEHWLRYYTHQPVPGVLYRPAEGLKDEQNHST